MTIIAAMLLDAYRALNARKLFWLTLGLSFLVVLSFGSIGFNEQGMSLYFGLKQIDSDFIREGSPWARALYMGIFSDFIVTFWLGWAATIIALISTTTIFPDFMATGAIDLVLAKPITRVKLFVIRYLTSLLFVLLQVTVFCLGIFLCVGGRLDEWNWKIFLGIPLVTVFYSYLYSINVLLGVITRSALAALMLTMLMWFSLWSVQTSESVLNQFKFSMEIQVEEADEEIKILQARLASIDDDQSEQRDVVQRQLEIAEEEREQPASISANLTKWHRRIELLQAPMPKTGLTVGLLSRSLKDPGGFSILAMMRGDMSAGLGGGSTRRSNSSDAKTSRRMEAYYEGISPWYIIGSSIAFEFVVLSFACLIFVRRDY